MVGPSSPTQHAKPSESSSRRHHLRGGWYFSLKQSLSQTHTVTANVIVIVDGVQEWASEDLLEASTNWAMRTDILRMEIGDLGIGNFGIIFFKCRGTEGYMWMLMLLPRGPLDQFSPGVFSSACAESHLFNSASKFQIFSHSPNGWLD